MAVLLHKPSRARRDPDPATDTKCDSWQNLDCERDPPPVICVQVGESVVKPEGEELSGAKDHLRYADDAAADGRRCDLSHIERNSSGAGTHAISKNNAADCDLRDAVAGALEDGADDEDDACKRQSPLATTGIGQDTDAHGSHETSDVV